MIPFLSHNKTSCMCRTAVCPHTYPKILSTSSLLPAKELRRVLDIENCSYSPSISTTPCTSTQVVYARNQLSHSQQLDGNKGNCKKKDPGMLQKCVTHFLKFVRSGISWIIEANILQKAHNSSLYVSNLLQQRKYEGTL